MVRDGRQLFIEREGKVPNAVQRLDLATGRVEPWKELTLEDRAGIVRISPVQVAADGRSWAYGYVRVLSNLYVVEGLKWGVDSGARARRAGSDPRPGCSAPRDVKGVGSASGLARA